MSSILISTAIFCLLGVAGTGVYVALYGSHRVLQERFAEMAAHLQITEGVGVFDQDREPEGLGRTLFQWALQRMPKPKVSPSSDKTTQTLVRAGFIRSGSLRTFQLIRMLSVIVIGLVGLVVAAVLGLAAGRVMLIIVGSIAAGYFAPLYYLRKRANRRQKDIARQLSDVLDLLVVCVEAGLGLFESIKIVGDETERQGQAIGTELALVSVEVAAGGSLGQALRNLAERTAVDDVRPLAATLIQSEQLGSQIGPALRSSSDSLRTKRRFRAEEAAQKSTIKILFPLVLFILPAMLIVLLAPAMIQAVRTLSAQG
jgi:tight adherence protein C